MAPCFIVLILFLLLESRLSSIVEPVRDAENNEHYLAKVRTLSAETPVTRFAIGSCNRHYLPQTILAQVPQTDPQLWIWMGDAVYADTRVRFGTFVPTPEQEVKNRYNALLSNPAYQKLAEKVPIIGIYDDHDYNCNNGDKTHPGRDLAKRLYLDFVGEPLNSPRRTQSGGAYTVYFHGPSHRKVAFILLDVRYSMDRTTGDVLGPQQWEWLEQTLKSSDAKIHFIVSGLQILQSKILGEDWGQYPESRQRLFYIIDKTKAPGVVLLSGDVHYSELLRTDFCAESSHRHFSLSGTYRTKKTSIPTNAPPWQSKNYYYPPNLYPLYELTSSSMTHSWGNFNLPFHIPFNILNMVRPDEFIVRNNQTNAPHFFAYDNFGLVEIDWESKPSPKISLKIMSLTSEVNRWNKHYANGTIHFNLTESFRYPSLEHLFPQTTANSSQPIHYNIPSDLSLTAAFQEDIFLSQLQFTKSTEKQCLVRSSLPTFRRFSSTSILLILVILIFTVIYYFFRFFYLLLKCLLCRSKTQKKKSQ